MFRYLLILCISLVFSVACLPTTSKTDQSTEVQETPTENSEQEDGHHDEHKEEHEHEENLEDDDYREQGTHEHGVAILMMAWSDNEMVIDLETPAFNVLGFEYSPTSDAEQALLDENIATLEAGDFLHFSPEANCVLNSAVVRTDLAEEEHEDEEEHEEGEETHSDINVSYTIQCQNPDKLESLDISDLFARYPNFEELQVQWISDNQQSAKHLMAEDPVISFK